MPPKVFDLGRGFTEGFGHFTFDLVSEQMKSEVKLSERVGVLQILLTHGILPQDMCSKELLDYARALIEIQKIPQSETPPSVVSPTKKRKIVL